MSVMKFNRDNTSGCPCKNCKNKGCGSYHDICEKFQTWRKKIEKKRENERDFHKKMDTMSESKKRELWRQKRYQRHKRNQNNLRSE